jgi:6-pyruvoyltetrahydropterin/6-carboxytetrahydropterin synthase
MIYISRRIEFSAAHMYWVNTWSDEENRRVFGACSNLNGHGHDYALEVTVRGELNAQSGIVVNIVDVDRIAKKFISAKIDGKFLNRENDYFQNHMPTTENLVSYIWGYLDKAFPDCELYKVRLHENPFLYSEKELGSMIQLTRKYHFSAAHRLHSDRLSDEENIKIFGKCNNPNGHGHNYRLEVTVRGKINPVTGMIVDLAELDTVVERIVLNRFDHKHLNLDVDEFKDSNPTSEMVAMVIWNLLYEHVPNIYKIGLWETEKNYFEYCGSADEDYDDAV